MLKQQIILDNHIYHTEYYDANIDLKDDLYYKSFVMIRNYEIINNIVVDKDIYFIERDLYFNTCKDLKDNKSNTTKIITFPFSTNSLNGYTNSYKNFNTLFNDNSFYRLDKNENIKIGEDVYEIVDRNGNELKILCNKIRIYHPNSKININAVIHLHNYINGINFHYICKNYDTFKTKSETEIIIDNERYSEFIEIYFPNQSELFKDNNAYFYDDLNLSVSSLNDEFINNKNINSFKLNKEFGLNGLSIQKIEQTFFKNEINDTIFIQVKNSEIKFIDGYHETLLVGKIIEFDGDTPIIKLFDDNIKNLYRLNDILKNTKSITINGIPISLSLDDSLEYKVYNNLYSLNILIQPFNIVEEIVDKNTNIFVKQYIKLRKSIENNYLSYPLNINFYPFSILEENTSLYLIDENINANEISFYYDYRYELSSKLGFNEGKLAVINNFLYPNSENFTGPKEAYEYYYSVSENEYNNHKLQIENNIKEELQLNYKFETEKELEEYYNLYKEEIEDDLGFDIDFIGFKLAISSDIDFKNIIWKKYVPIDFKNLDNIKIDIYNVFNDWNEMPPLIVTQVHFIDRYLGNVIKSNKVVITKEWYKYMVNDDSIFIINSLNKKNNDMKTINLDNSSANFINNITCIINKEGNSNVNISKQNSTKLLYKPYFYRVSDLQNIKIRKSLIQNIGINLMEYMTKVETFKLRINNKEFIEIGRNDIYCIFSIDATQFTETFGRYDVLNQDDQYISSGEYTLY